MKFTMHSLNVHICLKILYENSNGVTDSGRSAPSIHVITYHGAQLRTLEENVCAHLNTPCQRNLR